MPQINEIMESLSGLTVLEVRELTKQLEAKWGVSAAPVPTAVPAIIGTAVAPIEEKATFTVILEAFGANKIGVIKEIRALTKLGLAEAKALVDNAPVNLVDDVESARAEEFRAALTAAGATVTIK